MMIGLRRHGPQDYATLPDIDAPDVGTLTVDDQACLAEIGDCLLQANAPSRFGATLLHIHLPVEKNEMFIEEVHADTRSIPLRPVLDAPFDLFATSLCFEGTASGESFGLVGLEFASKHVLA